VVLMSATADITRYKEYFRDLGRGERVEVLGIPSSEQHTLYQRRVSYLEQVVELLGMRSESLSLKYCSGPSPYSSEATLNEEVHELIHNLVLHIHKNEPDMEKSILIFLPTYHALEQQWLGLNHVRSAFKIHILHSSIDTEQALNAMSISKSHRKETDFHRASLSFETLLLVQKVMDPPRPEVVDDALELLVHIHALEKTVPRGRYEPTFYGRLLSSFSLSFDASMLIIKFGEAGLLREGIIIGILMDTQPLPIIRPFGQEALFSKFTDDYYIQDGKLTGLMGRKEVIFMANFCAFKFWQRFFKDDLRLDRLKHLLEFDETTNTQVTSLKIEEEWCLFHNLVQSSLQRVADIYETVLNSVHRYRPNFLATSNGLPSYYEPYDFHHTCLLTVDHGDDSDPLATDDDSNPIYETKKCIALPFVDANGFNKNEVAFRLANSIKEMRICYLEDSTGNHQIQSFVSYNGVEASLCRFFINGTCNKGAQCLFSHSLEAKRPVCKFFYSLQVCTPFILWLLG
ncbi:hypothetical protein M8C21_018382, partial [Ambrosia artemisiifolia]